MSEAIKNMRKCRTSAQKILYKLCELIERSCLPINQIWTQFLEFSSREGCLNVFGPISSSSYEWQAAVKDSQLFKGDISSWANRAPYKISVEKYLMFACVSVDNSILDFSAASVRRWRACLSLRRSMPSSFLKVLASQSTIFCVIQG